MGFLSKLWENWGKGKNSGIEIKSAKKAPAIKKTKKKKTKKKKKKKDRKDYSDGGRVYLYDRQD